MEVEKGSRGPLPGREQALGPNQTLAGRLVMSCCVWLGSGLGTVPPQRPNVVGDNKRVETLNVVVIHGGHPSGLSFSPWAQ